MKSIERTFKPVLLPEKLVCPVPISEAKTGVSEVTGLPVEKTVSTLASELKKLLRDDQDSRIRTNRLSRGRFG